MLLPQKQPNLFSCFPTAFAIILGIPVEQLFKEIGHDGSTIVDPSCPDPFNRRGFHSQELIRYARTHGFSVSSYEENPLLGDLPIKTDIPIDGNLAVLGGLNFKANPHAVAWDGYRIIDPAGNHNSKFVTEIYYIFDWIK